MKMITKLATLYLEIFCKVTTEDFGKTILYGLEIT